MSLLLLNHPEAQTFLRDFQELHLSEVEFLLQQRQRRLQGPEPRWMEAAGVEERLATHLEALRTSSDIAVACAHPLLSDGDDGERMAAALTLASLSPEEEGWPGLVHAMEAAPAESAPLWEKALLLVERPGWVEQLTALLGSPRPWLRACAANLLGWRREGEGARLRELLEDEPQVAGAAALALGKLGQRQALPLIERKLQQDPMRQEETLWRGALLLGSQVALHVCRDACRSGSMAFSFHPRLLAFAGAPEDFQLLRRLCDSGENPTALESLGIQGVPTAVPLLLEYLSAKAPATRGAAASALTLLTGADLTQRRVLTEPMNDDEPPEQELEEPSTNASEWRRWWQTHRERFVGSKRFRRGQPHAPIVCIEELSNPRSPYTCRAQAALELEVRIQHPIGFEPDWPVRRQHQALARWRQEWGMRSWP
ncbi:hypothetical protein JQX13_22030 [Archangium violaceum]|uniref:hypothetical protein n=1 Tax=Archangium violaceum TaxID=83451 RepID=UPI00193AFF86|nr:hypothetical protein [Archangium violaceum]QRK12464.1 hypothetical protein JQX13_22030 [Archangium violaceum]